MDVLQHTDKWFVSTWWNSRQLITGCGRCLNSIYYPGSPWQVGRGSNTSLSIYQIDLKWRNNSYLNVYISCDFNYSLGSEIKVFIRKLIHWLISSLEDVPKKLTDKKIEGKCWHRIILLKKNVTICKCSSSRLFCVQTRTS